MASQVRISQVLKRVTSEELDEAINEVEVSIDITLEETPPSRSKWPGWLRTVIEFVTMVLVRIGWARTSPT